MSFQTRTESPGGSTRAYQTDPTVNSQALFGNGFVTAPVWNVVGDWSRTVNTNLVNDVRFGWSHITLNTGTTFDPSLGAFGNTIGIGNGNPSNLDGLLGLGVGNVVTGLGNSLVTQSFDSKVWQAEDSLTYTHGRHALKFGAQFMRISLRSSTPATTVSWDS